MIEKLRPHQVEPARKLLSIVRQHGIAVDGSGTGTGKTYAGSFVVASLELPTLIVGPKVSKAPWARALAHFGTSASFCNYELLRTGNTPFGQWDKFKPGKEYLVCEVCQCKIEQQPCPYHPLGIHSAVTKRTAPRYGNFVFHPAVKLIIFDESHRMNGLDSLNAELLIAARRQNIKTLCLSATLAQSPLHMRALGYALDFHADKRDYEILRNGQLIEVPGFTTWARRYGVRFDPRFKGLHWFASGEEQKRIMRELNNQIFPARGIRIRSEDIPGFPKRVILPELYSVEKVQEQYERMKEAIECLNTTKLDDKNPEHPLTKILRARQEIELLKVPIMAELAEDDRAKGFSVVFFVNFSATISELKKLFPNAGIIDGATAKTRDSVVDQFQSNAIGELIVNNEAGGVCLSLQDLTGDFPRMGYFSPNFSATTAEQIFGRLQRDGGKSTCYYRVILADDSTEKAVHSALCRKLGALGSLMDGALTDDDFLPDELSKLRKIK